MHTESDIRIGAMIGVDLLREICYERTSNKTGEQGDLPTRLLLVLLPWHCLASGSHTCHSPISIWEPITEGTLMHEHKQWTRSLAPGPLPLKRPACQLPPLELEAAQLKSVSPPPSYIRCISVSHPASSSYIFRHRLLRSLTFHYPWIAETIRTLCLLATAPSTRFNYRATQLYA
jgi:hypothetical protein